MKGRKKRSSGGGTMKVSGNPNVFKEAAERKKGGRVERATGGKVVGLMTGGAVKPRLDRPGRKSGGRVGANKAPLSTAHSTVSAPATPGNNADSN
jgi:hypothetical protein